MFRRYFLILIICFMYMYPFLNAQEVTQSDDFLIQSGLSYNAILAQDISSKTAIIGQEVNAILMEDIKTPNGEIVVPKESVLIGSVVAHNNGSNDEYSSMQVKFTRIRTLYNNIIPISAVIGEEGSEGILVANKEQGVEVFANTEIKILLNQPITLKKY